MGASDLMPSGVDPTHDARVEVRGQLSSVRAQMREMAAVASRLAPSSKLAKRASVLMLDYESLDDRVAECGGEENLVFMLCAQVASGVSLKVWCEHYGVDRGLVWALLSENREWLDRYYRAQEGMADEYVGEVVGIADGTLAEDVQVRRLRIDTRFKVAGKYASSRFGEKSAQVNVQVVNQIDSSLGDGALALLDKIRAVAVPVTVEASANDA